MSFASIVIESPLSAVGLKSVLDLAPGQLPAANNLIDYLTGVTGGSYVAKLTCLVGALKASGTVTFASTGPTNGQTCTIAGVTFTAVTSSATGNQFNISATPATVAANLALAINAAPSMVGIVTATSALGVTTISVVAPGTVGNGVTMANVNLSNTTIVSFAGGSNGTSYVLDLD